MKRSTIVTAIDIGTTKVAAIIGKRDETGHIEVVGLGETVSTGVKRGVVLNIEETVNAIQKAVELAQNMAGVKITESFVGIAGQHIKSVKSRGTINTDARSEEITQSDVDRLIENMYGIPINPGEEIIHIIPQSFIVDNETDIKNPVGMFGKRLEANFHIVIGQTMAANNIKKCIRRCGIEPIGLILEPLASSRAILTDDEKEVGVALVDIGGGTTDIAIYHDDIIRHTAVVPFGGNVITLDIKQAYSILERQAESLKIQHGSAFPGSSDEDYHITIPGLKGRDPKEISCNNLAFVIQARIDEIFGAIDYQIETSGFGGKLGAGIVLTGGGALLKNLPQRVSYITGKDIRLGYPNEYLRSDVIKDINHPKLSTAIGLLLLGFERVKDEFNFVEDEAPKIMEEPKQEPQETAREESFMDESDESSDKKDEKKKAKKEKKEKGKRGNWLGKLVDDFFDGKDNKIEE
ncbi:MAG: cell division protein FtsA [Bacteroidia bacterium]|nr:cell division protein FtsA [Bacteroidia bacterium]